ncbi:MAG: MtrB/PioB family outer membrane beta-barrel protein [Deltaproteobacteria bacterium]|nr:MtrB/PioB family outer membrane beta-barrel protein [Deltaproteobacteria bacterium]
MKIKREILVVFLAVMFITLTCAGGFAELNVGDYTLSGQISVGGGWLSDQPRHMNRGYLKQYLPFEQGFLAETDVSLKSKEGLEYYRFWMSNPGLRGAQDFLLQVGKIGVYHAQIEYDELQHLYCTVNPSIFANNNIGILVQRLRFSGYYTPTPEIAIFAENQFLKRTGWQANTYEVGPGNPYNFTTTLRAIKYNQNDMKVGVEYDRPTDEKSPFQARVSYHLSTFENGNALMQNPVGNAYISLPPSNMANYVTGEGALDLKAYKTRLTGSLTYGWLAQNDYVNESTTSAATATPRTFAGRFDGLAGLGASTFTANIAGVTRPIAPLTLRYSYNAYNFENNNTANQILTTAFSGTTSILRPMMQYSYLRQGANLGADYRVNNMLAFTAGYTWQGVDRTNGQGTTSSSSPQVGLRLTPTSWLSLNANYAYTVRLGWNFMVREQEGEAGVPITYKSYTGNLNRNAFNFIAEVLPANNITTSFNFSIYNDNFLDSTLGIQSDRGWSTGVDVSWRPHDRVALSLGYDHQQLQTKELAATTPILGEVGLVTGDFGPTLTTSDAYDTFIARADFKLIPKKLDLTTRGSYSIAHSNFNEQRNMLNLNEYYADIRTFLTYRYNEHWAVRAGYIFEAFGMPQAYQTLYLQGITAKGLAGNNQRYNTLDGFFTNATAHVVQAFLQYKF